MDRDSETGESYFWDSSGEFNATIYDWKSEDKLIVSLLSDYAFRSAGNKKGIRHYRKVGDADDPLAIMGVIAKGRKIAVSGRPVYGKWHKVLDQVDGKEGGYVLLSGKEKFTVSPTFTSYDIVGCDLPVKAGALIGTAGDFGHEIDGKYKDSCHSEIFTGDEVEAFLNNASEERLDYLKLTASNEFSADLQIKALPKGYPVEVIEKRGDYSKVKIPKLVKTVPFSYLGIYSSSLKSYALKGETNESYIKRKAPSQLVELEVQDLPQANLVELQNIFGRFLTAEDRLHYKSETKTERVVYFDHPMAGRTVWIETDALVEPMMVARPAVQVTSSSEQSVKSPLASIIID